MAKKPLNLSVDEDLVKKARDHGLVISRFLENKLQEYFSFIDSIYPNLPSRFDIPQSIRRGRDLNSRSPKGEPALKAGALGQTLLPRQQ